MFSKNKEKKNDKKNAKAKAKTKTESKKVVKELGDIQPWVDKVSPSLLEFKKDSFCLEQAHCAVYSIFSFPPEVGLKWLRPITMMENTIVKFCCDEGNKADLIKTIEYSIREQQIRQLENAQTKITQAVDAQDQIEKSLELSSRIMSENVNVMNLTVYIMVFGDSEDDLKKRCKDLEGRLSGLRMVPRRFPYLQAEGFDSMNPICDNQYKDLIGLTIPNDVFYAGCGFVPSYGINDPTGMYLGFDETSNPIFLDIWSKSCNKTNSNCAIVGKSGSGKSASTKTILVNELAKGTKVYVLDPEEEYLSIAGNFNGDIIEASGSLNPDKSKTMINPLQLTDFPEEWDDMTEQEILALQKKIDFQGTVSKKITWLKGWFQTYQPELRMEHLALLETALYETYKRKGCSETSDPRKMKNTDHPTMTDLGKVLAEFKENAPADSVEARIYGEILVYLRSALVGADRFLFNGYTNIDMSNPFVVFNVHSLLSAPDNIKNSQFANITSFIWLAMTKNRNERAILVVDEAHLFINDKCQTTFQFLGELCKRCRKYNGALMITTQNISDFLNPAVERYGSGILNNSSIRLIMKTDGNDLEKIADLYAFNDGEYNLIKHAQRGQGLLVAGDMRVFANIMIEPNVLKLCQAGGGK